jgi:hypothetical protein
MDTAPFFPYCHGVMVVAPVWAWDKPQDKLRATRHVSSLGQARKYRFITKFNGKLRTYRESVVYLSIFSISI